MLVSRPGVAAEAPVPDSPWLKAENAEKYVFLGKTVWDIDAGKVVSQTGAPDVWETSRWIVGVRDRLYDAPASGPYPPGMAASGRIVMLNGAMPQTPSLADGPRASQGAGPQFWINDDRRRVVWIQGGDYWRGEIDWANDKIINRRQITSVGAFNAGTTPMLWWGQLLYVAGGFDKAKPIVRINLATGDVAELERYGVWPMPPIGNSLVLHVNPGNSRLFNPTESVIYCYDVRTGKPSMFRNKFEIPPIGAGGGSQGLFPDYLKPVWSDDDNVYCFDGQGFLYHCDLRNAAMDILRTPPLYLSGPPPFTSRLNGIVPGTHLLDIARIAYQNAHEATPGVQEQHRLLLDVTNNQETPLPFDNRAMGKWITDSLYLYVLTQGGLSHVGTWVYDRVANTNKHLSSVQIDEGRMVLLGKRHLVIAISQQTGGTLIRLNLDGSPARTLGQCGLDIPRCLPDVDNAIDLGFPGSPGAGADLWKPVVVDEAALAATRPAEAPAGKLKLLELIKNMPAADQAFAEACYDYVTHNSSFNNFCDPIQFGMKAVDMHHANPSDPPGNIAFKMDISGMGDPERITHYGRQTALGRVTNDSKLTDNQKLQIIEKTGPMLLDAWQHASPKPKNGQLNQLFEQCFAQAKQNVTGIGSPTPQSQPPTQPPQQTQQQQQQQSPQQQKPTYTPPIPHPPPKYKLPKFKLPYP